MQLYICVLAKRHADVNAECGNYSKELRGFRGFRGFRELRDLKDFRDFKDLRDLRRCMPQHLAESLFVIGELLLQTLACRVYARLDCA